MDELRHKMAKAWKGFVKPKQKSFAGTGHKLGSATTEETVTTARNNYENTNSVYSGRSVSPSESPKHSQAVQIPSAAAPKGP